MTKPDPVPATVIICTRDRPDALRACLVGLAAQDQRPESVVVVAGTPESVPADVQGAFPGLSVRIESCPDMNICRSRNIGLAACGSEVAVFIDDDAVPRDGWLGGLVAAVRTDPSIWMAGGHVYDARQSPMPLEFAFGTLRRSGRQRPVRGSPGGAARGGMPAVKGCNFAVRTVKVRGMGGFDEFFVFGFDEADVVVRVWDSGGRVVHAPEAAVDHFHTPGLFRSAHPLDRDWTAELASHGYFGLKHSSGLGRLWVRVLVRARVVKIGVRGVIEAARGRVPAGSVVRAVRMAQSGVRRAEQTALGRG